jgi:Family of unknown function (DUF6328)
MTLDPRGIPSGSDGRETGEPREDLSTRLTRNLNELLQELRVMQTGVQILTGFLLTLPFTSRFPDLTLTQKYVYLAVLSGSIITTGLIVAPVAFHRALFRQGERKWIVESANRAARYGLSTLAATMAGVVWLVFDVVVGGPASHIAGALSITMFAVLWGVLPVVSRRMSANGPGSSGSR